MLGILVKYFRNIISKGFQRSKILLTCSRKRGLFSQEQHMAFIIGAPLLGTGTMKKVGVEVKQNRETQSIPVILC